MAEKKKLTAAEREKLRRQIAELQAALDDKEEASTPGEEEAAQEEVEEQQQKLAELFDRLGLTEADYDLLIEALGRGLDDHVKHLVREELGEEAVNTGTVKDLAENPPGEGEREEGGDTPPESPPASAHWTTRKLFGKKDEPEEENE